MKQQKIIEEEELEKLTEINQKSAQLKLEEKKELKKLYQDLDLAYQNFRIFKQNSLDKKKHRMNMIITKMN